jgi:hypothetical protein
MVISAADKDMQQHKTSREVRVVFNIDFIVYILGDVYVLFYSRLLPALVLLV